MSVEHADYLAKPDYIVCKANTKNVLSPSTALRRDDSLSRHRLSYLSGGGGSGKTTPEIELFRQRDPLVFTPDPSPGQGDAGQGRPGPDRPQLLLLEWPDGVDA